MNQKLIIALVIALAIVGYDYKENRPKRLSAIYQQQTTNQTLRDDLATALDAKKKIKAVESKIKKTKTQIEKLMKQLPKKHQAGALLEQITVIAKDKGLRFDAVNPKGSAKKTFKAKGGGKVSYQEVQLDLDLISTFPELGKYLESLEKLPRLVDVSGMKLEKKSVSQPLKISMHVKTYIYGGK